MIKDLLTWKDISAWSTVNTMKASVFYISLCALASKSLSQLSEIRVGENGSILVDLPFSWQLLFYGSIFYLAGYILYLVFCPAFIRQYPNFSDLRGSSYIGSDLQEELQQIQDMNFKLPVEYTEDIDLILKCLTIEDDQKRGSYYQSMGAGSCSEVITTAIANNEIENCREAFNLISNSWEKRFAAGKVVVSLLYLLFLLAVLVVLFENIYFVTKYLLL